MLREWMFLGTFLLLTLIEALFFFTCTGFTVELTLTVNMVTSSHAKMLLVHF